MEEDRVTPAFKGRHILLTGGTGFLGKTFVEKLLRVTETEKIYLLMRFKKGKPPRERLLEMFRNPLFDIVKKQIGLEKMVSRIELIEGDVAQIGLGLSDEDRELIVNNVTLIYHVAATIRFDEMIKKAVELNTRGTQEMIKLALECKKLEVFCYVSTAYAYLNETFLMEKPYDPPADPQKLIKSVELLSEDEVEKMRDEILGNFPNSYSFTKAMAESMVCEAREKHNLPILIIRPSIVIPTLYEPVPGWTDNLNGPAGLMIGAGKGVIRSIYCAPKSYGDFLPVDIAINGLVTAMWYRLTFPEDIDQQIVNFTSSQDIQVSWEGIIDMGREIVDKKYPMYPILWYPGGYMTSSKIVHKVRSFCFHWVPAVLIDILLFCIGMKPFMWRVQTKVAKGIDVLTYYASNQWDFSNYNQIFMRGKMNRTELTKYKVDAEGVDVYDYFEKSVLGARRYLLNLPDENLPASRRLMRVMYFVDKICKTIIYGYLLYWLSGLILPLFFSPEQLSDFYTSIRQMFGTIQVQKNI